MKAMEEGLAKGPEGYRAPWQKASTWAEDRSVSESEIGREDTCVRDIARVRFGRSESERSESEHVRKRALSD